MRGSVLLCLALFSASGALGYEPPSLQNLADVFDRHHTDKGAIRHNYTAVYVMLLGPWRMHVHSVLEIGLGSLGRTAANMRWVLAKERRYKPGASLRAWREYFPHAHIYGIDIDAAAVAQLQGEERITTFAADASNPGALEKLTLPTNLDLIIDDGSHEWQHQQTTLLALWGHLRPGGYYIIEDVPIGNRDIVGLDKGRKDNEIRKGRPDAMRLLREQGAFVVESNAFPLPRPYNHLICLMK